MTPLDLAAVERDRIATERAASAGDPAAARGDRAAALRLATDHVPALVARVRELEAAANTDGDELARMERDAVADGVADDSLHNIRRMIAGLRMASLLYRSHSAAMRDAAREVGCDEEEQSVAGAARRLRLRAEAAEAEVVRLRAVVAALPVCDACDSAPATYETPEGFRGCDEHPSEGGRDLPWAAELRALDGEPKGGG